MTSLAAPYHGHALCCPSHDAAREQSSRSLSSTNSPTRASNAKVQIHGSRATILVGTRRRSESLWRRPSSATGCSPSSLKNACLPGVERRDGYLLTNNGSPTSKRWSRTIRVNVTVPPTSLPNTYASGSKLLAVRIEAPQLQHGPKFLGERNVTRAQALRRPVRTGARVQTREVSEPD